jgi:hypothetical protein
MLFYTNSNLKSYHGNLILKLSNLYSTMENGSAGAFSPEDIGREYEARI